jgi:hypothetical protein
MLSGKLNCVVCFQTNVGPILLSVNPYSDVGNPLTLTSTRGVVLSPKLLRVVQEAVRQQSETGYPQAIILSGMTTQLFVTMCTPCFPSGLRSGRSQTTLIYTNHNLILVCCNALMVATGDLLNNILQDFESLF